MRAQLIAGALLCLVAPGAGSPRGAAGSTIVQAQAAASSDQCGEAAAPLVEQGFTWLAVLSTGEARAAFESALARDPSCALARLGVAIAALDLLRAEASPQQLDTCRTTIAPIVEAAGPAAYAWARALGWFCTAPARSWRLRLVGLHERLASSAPAFAGSARLLGLRALVPLALSTAPGDVFAQNAATIADEALAIAPSDLGAALVVLLARDTTRDASQARDALAAFELGAPDVPMARHVAAHIHARLGAWDRVEAAHADVSGTFPPHGRHTSCDGREWLVAALLARGRFARATELIDAEAARAASDEAARRRVIVLRARLLLADCPRRPVPSACSRDAVQAALDLSGPTIPTAGATDRHLVRRATLARLFVGAYLAAWRAWPGGNPDELTVAHQLADRLETDLPGDPAAVRARGAALAAIAAAQEERDLMRMMLVHASDADRRLLDAEDPALPLVPLERLTGDLWLQVHRFADAREAYEAATRRDPADGHAWLGLARTLHAERAATGEGAGGDDALRAAVERFTSLWADADRGRPELTAAAALR